MPVAGQAIVYIRRSDDGVLVASGLAVETRQARDAGTSIIYYPRTSPPAIRAWFHPANAIGFEFVYPPAEAKAIYLAADAPVPYAATRELSQALVGTYQVRGFGWPAAAAPEPAGTSGVAVPVATLTPAQHLASARREIARHLSDVDDDSRARMLLIIELIERLEKAHAADDDEKRHGELTLLRNTLRGIVPPKPTRFSGNAPLPEQVVLLFERVGAHLNAFVAGVGDC